MKRPGWMGLGLLGLAGLFFGMRILTHRTFRTPGQKPQPIPVRVGRVVARALPEQIQAIGTVEPFNTVTIRPQVDGQITDVFFKQGQIVSAGEKLFEIDPRPYRTALDQAEAGAKKDRATLDGAKADLERYGTLVRKHYTSTQTYDDLRVKVDELKATVTLDQAAIESARLNLSHATIRAPISGRTGAILVNRGNIVRASIGAPLVTIAELKPIYVSFAVPQRDLPLIRQYQSAKGLVVTALNARTGDRLASGRLSFIDNKIDTTTGTVTLMATFPNRQEHLWPGEYVTGRLTLVVQADVLTVPEAAVVEGPDGDYVYVIDADDSVLRHKVSVTRREDGLAVIGKGLASGTPVVTDGQFRLRNGFHVTIETNPSALSGGSGA